MGKISFETIQNWVILYLIEHGIKKKPIKRVPLMGNIIYKKSTFRQQLLPY